ncbi:MAG: tRNA dimethylallyltransferase, partial [Bacteroidota bacterium]
MKKNSGNKYLVVLGGATATGKTAAAVAVARHFQTEIISADSRQFYREMTIGTAKPSPEELSAVPHHFINSLGIGQAYSVGDFEREALELLEVLFQKQDVVVLAGGSGLFIRGLCEGLDE